MKPSTGRQDWIPEPRLERAARVLRLLAHPQRLRIIEVLEGCDSAAVHEIMAATDMAQAVASQHLNQMKHAGLLVSRREGREMRYSVADRGCLGILACVRGKGGQS